MTAIPAHWKTIKVFGRPWQDWVFSLGEIVFLLGLIPSVLNHQTPSVWTSLPTAIMLYAFMVVQWSYGNWITVALGFVTATLWLILYIQAVS